MKYISKGIVVEGSTEHILRLTRCGYDFQLTGEQAVLWLNGRRRESHFDKSCYAAAASGTHRNCGG